MASVPGVFRIFVVDTYAGWRVGVGNALAAAGYEVWTARSGKEAHASLRTLADSGRPIDLLLTEIDVGDMTGEQLDGHARVLWPRLRVLYMSYDVPPDSAGSLCKPFSLETLEEAVRRVLRPQGARVRCA